MEKFERWQKNTADLYKRGNYSNQHGFLDDLNPSVLGWRGARDKELALMPHNETSFYNIAEFKPKLFDIDFLQESGCGVYLKNDWPEQLDGTQLFVYLAPSPNLTTFKKALISDRKFKSIDLGVDPYGLGLWKSTLFKSRVDKVALLNCVENGDHFFRISSQPYSMAGASDVQQLAILISSIIQVINNCEGLLSPIEVLKSISFEVTLKPNLFLSIAKIQTLRILIQRVLEIYEITEDIQTPIYTAPAVRYLSSREPWNNILRLTAINGASFMGGAQGIVSLAFDFLSKGSGSRVSRNINQVLGKESHLGKVNDPSRGSYTSDNLVGEMCSQSWQLINEIAKKEGMSSSLRSGWIHDQIKRVDSHQQELFLNRKLKITGVNDFVLGESLSEENPVSKESEIIDIETWWTHFIFDEEAERLCDVERLVPASLSTLLERWQYKTDQLRERDTNSSEIALVIEAGMESSSKAKKVKEVLGLAGLGVRIVSIEEIKNEKIYAVIAADPDGEFSKNILKERNEVFTQTVLWVGDKKMLGFDGTVGDKSHLVDLFSQIFNALGVQ